MQELPEGMPFRAISSLHDKCLLSWPLATGSGYRPSISLFAKQRTHLILLTAQWSASMEVDLSQTALLIVDCQKGFEHPTHWGHTRSNPDFEANLTALLEAFRSKHGEHSSAPIIHIVHESSDPASPLFPDGPGADFLPYAKPRPGEVVISKTVNSAFIGTDLDERIRAYGIRKLYIAGLTTGICPFHERPESHCSQPLGS